MLVVFLFGILGFLLLSNISFQIPIGIAIFTLIIWRLLEFNKDRKESNKTDDKKEEKNNKLIFMILIIGSLIAILLGIIFYNYNPIKSIENKSGINYLSNYTYDVFVLDKPYFSTFISVFPICLIIGVYYIFKDETKHLRFIVPSVIISILQIILLVSNIKFSFLPNYIFALGFNLLQIYMVIYIFSRIEEKLFNLIKSAYISLLSLVFLIFLPKPTGLNLNFIDLSYIIFILESYIVLNYSDRRFWRLASWVFTVICFLETSAFLIVKIM